MRTLLALGALALLVPERQARSEDELVIQSISGNASDIQIVRADRWRQVPAAGAKFPRDTTIVTGADASVRVAFPDGSVVQVGRSTELHLDSITPGNSAVSLEKGRVRANVTKASSGAAKSHRFRVKTHSVTMGVRGTDFTAEVDHEQVAIHVLDGEVDCARSPDALERAPEHTLHPGQAMDVQPGASSAPYSFDPAQFLQNWEKDAPVPLHWWEKIWIWLKSLWSRL
jgi:hypothetical protein